MLQLFAAVYCFSQLPVLTLAPDAVAPWMSSWPPALGFAVGQFRVLAHVQQQLSDAASIAPLFVRVLQLFAAVHCLSRSILPPSPAVVAAGSPSQLSALAAC